MDKTATATLIVLLALSVSMVVVMAALPKPLSRSDLDGKITYLEVYQGFTIYRVQGGNHTFYLTQSPVTHTVEAYSNLTQLKQDIETQELEFNLK